MAVTLLGEVDTEGDTTPADLTASAGSNRVMIHLAAIDGAGDTMDTLTWRGQSATRIDAATTAEWNGKKIYLWYMLESTIAAGTGNSFTAGYTGSPAGTRMSHWSLLISDAAQSAPTVYDNTDTDTSDPVELTLAGLNGSLFAALARVNESTDSWEAFGNSWTTAWEHDALLGSNDSTGGYIISTDNSNQTASVGYGTADNKGMLAVRVDRATGGGTASTFCFSTLHGGIK